MGTQSVGDSLAAHTVPHAIERPSSSVCLLHVANVACVEATAGLGKGTQEKERDKETA